MDDIAEQLARRDRFRKQIALQRTPAERMQIMAQMQEQAWEILRKNPEGYAHFLRRNFKARACDYREPNA